MKTRPLQLTLAMLVLSLWLAPWTATALELFSEGMTLPESISLAPSGFSTYGGWYIVPDNRASQLWAVSPDGNSV